MMLSKSTLAAALALLSVPFLASASPAPVATDTEAEAEVPFSWGVTLYNETDPAPVASGPVEKRDFCGYGTDFNNADMNSLANWLQNTDPWSQTYLPHQSVAWWKWGTAMICVRNLYLFEDTHIPRWEAGWAVKYIRDNLGCCNGGSTW